MMTTASEKLAQSLDILKELQDSHKIVLRSKDLSRVHRERLLANGFLQEVMKGWFIPARPDEVAGESTAWYTCFWEFCGVYLNERFGDEWCLSPEQSLSLHMGNWVVPRQLLVRSPQAGNKVTRLLHDTSLFDVRYTMPPPDDIVEKKGLRVYSLTSALLASSPQFFTQNPTDARTALLMISDASEILVPLLEGGHSTIAGRLAGAFRNIGRDRIADEIVKTMRAADYDVREHDPFKEIPRVVLPGRERSPYINRMRVMWYEMREVIIKEFPIAPGLPTDKKSYLDNVEEIYETDAYNSLSIEGYRVTPELIKRVRARKWDPDNNANDREHKNALAARGYWQAFQSVKKSVAKVLKGKTPGKVVDQDHSDWYRELFGPGVTAGILKQSDLAGYRNGPVYIRRSMHVPPSCEAARDLMPAFFNLLNEENEASVRIVLGHFLFVYIHPYYDGNGRIARFLMNTMMAAAGYPWTVIPVERRKEYFDALEKASADQNIKPFCQFIKSLLHDSNHTLN